jgi:integrase
VIKGLWNYASSVGGEEGKFIKLCLIMGKRSNAVAKMTWEQIDDAWYWTPAKGTKRKRNNPIPLPKLAQRVLGKRDTGFVLGRLIPKSKRDKISANLKKAVEPTFFLHGLRHVVITKLRELKVSPDIARMVTDHALPKDAHSGYEHVDWTAEMLAALEKWCAYIEAVVAPAGARVLR